METNKIDGIKDESDMKKIEYAGFWIRLSASMWDGIILGIPTIAIVALLVWVTKIQPLGSLVVLALLIITIYMDGIKGGTPGKLILGLKIENKNGDYIGIGGALLRFVGRILSELILFIGYLMISWDKRKQGLHDKIAGTYVIKTKERKGLFILGLILFLIPLILLPILVAIGSLAYFGVLAPSKFMPESCTIGPGFSCDEFNLDSAGVLRIVLRNGLGENVESVQVKVENDCNPRLREWKDGEAITFSCFVTLKELGSVFNQPIIISYNTLDGDSKVKQGVIKTKYA
ncbi:MAG TPA: RDD family protein [Candidatus Nanoarchaeia archaeon]|nr:RDD family protein [Candidatus Nanoarchaeia archaeon]